MTLAAGGAWVLAEGDFPDVADDHPQAEAIQWAASEDLFRGFLDGNFRPDRELTEGQFNKVVKRLFDRYDSWTRAEAAAFLWRGAEADHSSGVTPRTQAPAPPPQANCAWPLGEPHWIGDPYTSFRFPIMEDCGGAYVVRVEDQSFNVRAGADFTPGFQWRRDWNVARMDVRWNGRNLGSRQVEAGSITTTTTTTTLPRPAATIPSRQVSPVPYDQRDLVFHWFEVPHFIPSGYGTRVNDDLYDGISGLVVYLADPDGPHPGQDGEVNFRVNLHRVPGGSELVRMSMYNDQSRESAFPYNRIFDYGTSSREQSKQYLSLRTQDFIKDRVPFVAGRPFRSVSFVNVATPVSEECRLAWLGFERVPTSRLRAGWEYQQKNSHITNFPNCNPFPGNEWWGKYSD